MPALREIISAAREIQSLPQAFGLSAVVRGKSLEVFSYAAPETRLTTSYGNRRAKIQKIRSVIVVRVLASGPHVLDFIEYNAASAAPKRESSFRPSLG